jgi:hypothetical protein
MQTQMIRKNKNRNGRLPVSISFEDFVGSINKLNKKEREHFLEDLLAATSPEYMQSIREARQDYKAGRTMSHAKVFEDLE